MSDAVSGALQALATVGGTVTSAEQIQGFKESRSGRATPSTPLPASGLGTPEEGAAAAAPVTPPPAAIGPTKEEFDALLRRLDASEKGNREMRSLLDRTHGAVSQLSQQRTAPAPVQMPALQVEDPDLAAVLNTLDQRNEIRLKQELSSRDQQFNQTLSRQQQSQFKSAVDRAREKNTRFGTYFTDEQLNAFAQPYISNPNFVNIDWEHEMELAYRTQDYPHLAAENARLQKELDAVKGKETSQRESQKKNLSQVPSGIGARGGNGNSSRMVADDVMRDLRKSGRRFSTQHAFSEIRKRLGYGT